MQQRNSKGSQWLKPSALSGGRRPIVPSSSTFASSSSWLSISKLGLGLLFIIAVGLLFLTAHITLNTIKSNRAIMALQNNNFVLRGAGAGTTTPPLPLDLSIPREVIITVPDRPNRPYGGAASLAEAMIASRASETEQSKRKQQQQKQQSQQLPPSVPLQQPQQAPEVPVNTDKLLEELPPLPKHNSLLPPHSVVHQLPQQLPSIKNKNNNPLLPAGFQSSLNQPPSQNNVPIAPPPPPPGVPLPPINPFTMSHQQNPPPPPFSPPKKNTIGGGHDDGPLSNLPPNLPIEALPPHLRNMVQQQSLKTTNEIPSDAFNTKIIDTDKLNNINGPQQYGLGKRAFFFTMDTLSDYITGASKGGAAGELIVREGLMWALETLGYTIDIAHSDPEMFQYMEHDGVHRYDLLFFDPWTIVDPTNRVRNFLLGKENNVFVLAFFGWNPTNRFTEFRLPPWHVLTAYPTDVSNTFLGFIVHPNEQAIRNYEYRHSLSSTVKIDKANVYDKFDGGTVWGKKTEYFNGREGALYTAARMGEVHIVTKENSALMDTLKEVKDKLFFHGSMDKNEWTKLLTSSKYLIGLGNPLLGPSALDALAAGTMYIDPVYDKVKVRPTDDSYLHMVSQHPYLKEKVGEPYVCSVDILDKVSVERCIQKALVTDLKPYVPPDFTEPYLLDRVTKIMEKKLQEAK